MKKAVFDILTLIYWIACAIIGLSSDSLKDALTGALFSASIYAIICLMLELESHDQT